MSDKKETPQLKEEIQVLAEKMEKGMTLDVKTGVGGEKESDVSMYETFLPETLSMETVEAVSDYNTNFIAAGMFAFGKLSVAAMAKNKDLTETNCELKMGRKDSVSFEIERSKEFVNHLGGGEKIEKFGVSRQVYDVRAGKNAGQLKVARQLIGEMAAEKLK